MSRSQLTFSGFGAFKERLDTAVQEKSLEAQDSLLEFIVAALNAGEFGLQSDRHALAQSLYVQATGRDDYQAARDAAREAFASARGDESDKAKKRFDELLAARSELPDKGPHVFVCAVATMLAYGTHWETDGGRPWMSPAAFEWAQNRAKEIYQELRQELR